MSVIGVHVIGMRLIGDPTVIRLIRATLDGPKSSFRIADVRRVEAGRRTFEFTVQHCTQGAIRRSGVQRNGTIITRSHMLLGFADDIDLIGIDRRSVEETFVPLKRETARIGLIIISTKTKYMVAGRNRVRHGGVGVEVVFDGDVFKVVEERRFLRSEKTCFGCE